MCSTIKWENHNEGNDSQLKQKGINYNDILPYYNRLSSSVKNTFTLSNFDYTMESILNRKHRSKKVFFRSYLPTSHWKTSVEGNIWTFSEEEHRPQNKARVEFYIPASISKKWVYHAVYTGSFETCIPYMDKLKTAPPSLSKMEAILCVRRYCNDTTCVTTKNSFVSIVPFWTIC